ncbi:MAG: hypothetical protein KJO69_10855, partial [Gammaproteobacteria bacterium]|nr:hypothetical protein [Gammaproteobacteria bacterium]
PTGTYHMPELQEQYFGDPHGCSAGNKPHGCIPTHLRIMSVLPMPELHAAKIKRCLGFTVIRHYGY